MPSTSQLTSGASNNPMSTASNENQLTQVSNNDQHDSNINLGEGLDATSGALVRTTPTMDMRQVTVTDPLQPLALPAEKGNEQKGNWFSQLFQPMAAIAQSNHTRVAAGVARHVAFPLVVGYAFGLIGAAVPVVASLLDLKDSLKQIQSEKAEIGTEEQTAQLRINKLHRAQSKTLSLKSACSSNITNLRSTKGTLELMKKPLAALANEPVPSDIGDIVDGLARNTTSANHYVNNLYGVQQCDELLKQVEHSIEKIVSDIRLGEVQLLKFDAALDKANNKLIDISQKAENLSTKIKVLAEAEQELLLLISEWENDTESQ